MATRRQPRKAGRRTVQVSEFKAHCLRLLTEVENGSELVITRRGKEIAVVRPAKGAVLNEYGSMKGLTEIRGEIVHNDWSDE